ncbi:MAG: Ig-like domain-containing protein [Sulfitobacter sp.]
MKAIDFVVRDNAGGLQRGVVSSEAQTHVIQAQAGQEISLNLRQIDLINQQRVGEDLIITLADGRVITIDNYFNASGAPNRLFISADGYLNEVAFVETDGGDLFAQFGPTEQWGKWSPSDDLIYLGRTEVAAVAGDDEVSMFAAPLLGAGLLGGGGAAAAAVVGGAAVIGGVGGGGSGGGGTPTPAAPFVDNPDASSTIGGDDSGPHVITVTGGGEPGDTVVVTIGDEVVETVINDDGVFEAVFEGDDFPDDGVYEAVVTVTTATGDVVLDGPDYEIDTTPPEVAVTTGTQSVDDFFNAESFEDGVTLTGTGEAGASVVVTIAGIAQSTTVSEDGTWSVTWAAGTLDAGEYTTGVTIVSADAFGNTTTVTDNLVVDTIANVTIDTDNVETDGVVNAVEREDGVTLTGSAQAGSTVVVTFGTGTHAATVDANGNWSVDFAMSEVPTGEMSATVSATATDSFGNTSTATGEVDIDTLVRDFAFTATTGGADGIINIEEATQGFTMTGTTEVGSTVSVVMNGFTHQATVAADGTWTVDFAASEIPTGTQTVVMTATATDAAGNVETITQDVNVDRDAGVLTISSTPVEGDDVINAVEASDGVTLTGTSNPNAVVTVTMGGVSHTVNADAAGNWSATYTNAEITPGEYTADIHATSTDSAGNVLNATDSVQVDTLVRDHAFTGTTGGADGIINIEEAAQGFTMTGTTEVGSTVSVMMNGFTHQATVAANGSWTVNFAANEIPTGTQTVVMTSIATDAAGNVDTITRDVSVDRDAGILTISSNPVEGDDVINAVEASDGVVLNGTSNPNAVVTVTMGGVSHTVTANASGNWTTTYTNAEITPGEYTADIHATTTDSAGNVLNATDSVQVDTLVNNLSINANTVEGNGVINAAERLEGGGVQVTGTTEIGSTSVVVTLNGIPVNAVVDANGNWTATYASSQVAEGTYNATVTVDATDRAGNTATVSDSILVDTEVVPLNMTNSGGGTDGVANIAEATTGIDLGGQVEPGSTVIVNFDGTNHTATVDAAGNWSLTIAPSDIRLGTYDAAIVVTATDANDNVDMINDTLAIDTDAPEGPVIASYTRDGTGIRGISTEMSAEDLAVYQVGENGSVSEVSAAQTEVGAPVNETFFTFNEQVPDGSHLVITATDDAGNASGTYVALDDEVAGIDNIALNAGTLGQHNIETVDLSFVEDGHLTIDEALLVALSANSNSLQINGGSDDNVTINGGQLAGSTVRDGQAYNIYTLGDEGTLYIDADVGVNGLI